MAGETTITIIGNLTDDPELRFLPNGTAMVKFTVASTPRTLDRQSGQWKDGDPLFLACTAWRDLAEHIAESLAKGTRVIVSGRIESPLALLIPSLRTNNMAGVPVSPAVPAVGLDLADIEEPAPEPPTRGCRR